MISINEIFRIAGDPRPNLSPDRVKKFEEAAEYYFSINTIASAKCAYVLAMNGRGLGEVFYKLIDFINQFHGEAACQIAFWCLKSVRAYFFPAAVSAVADQAIGPQLVPISKSVKSFVELCAKNEYGMLCRINACEVLGHFILTGDVWAVNTRNAHCPSLTSENQCLDLKSLFRNYEL